MTKEHSKAPTTAVHNDRKHKQTGRRRKGGKKAVPTDPGGASPAAPTESAVLVVLRGDGHPIPETLCRVCPHAMWWTTAQEQMHCYCRVMYMETYSSAQPARKVLITRCDGPGLPPEPSAPTTPSTLPNPPGRADDGLE